MSLAAERINSYLRYDSRPTLDHYDASENTVTFRARENTMDGAIVLKLVNDRNRFISTLFSRGKANLQELADTSRAAQAFIKRFRLDEELVPRAQVEMSGKIVQVFVVHTGALPRSEVNIPCFSGAILGVFPNSDQAHGYMEDTKATHLTQVSAFQPDGEDRVFLLAVSPFVLNVNYDPIQERKRRDAKHRAWEKLTEEERQALGLKRPS